MNRLDGDVYEQNAIPAEIEAEPGRIRRMCEDMIDQYAAIHLVDLERTGLDALGDGSDFVTRELDHWESEMQRVRRGPLPAMERLLAELRHRQPDPSPRVTLVHGDPKPGNVAFVGDRVSAVFDWELATVGDPLTDVGYLELMWAMPVRCHQPADRADGRRVRRPLRGTHRLLLSSTASGTSPCRCSRCAPSS